MNHKYKTIVLHGPFVGYNEQIEERDLSIFIRNFNLIESFLTNFCDLVRKIHVSFEYIDVAQGKFIVKFIDDLCSKTLYALNFENCQGICQLRKKFPLLSSFGFSSSQKTGIETSSNDFKWNFPRLEYLELSSLNEEDWTHIEAEQRSLREFAFHLPKSNNQNGDNTTHIINILAKNKFIELLDIKYYNLDILEKAHQYLRNFEYLILRFISEDYSDYKDGPIDLNRMWFLEIESKNADAIPTNLIFQNIDQLFLTLHHEFTDKWMEFIMNQVGVRLGHLHLSTTNLTKQQLMDIAENTKYLRAIDLLCETEFVADDILHLISSMKYLELLRLEINMNVAEQKILEESIPEKWKCDEITSKNMKKGVVKIVLQG